MALKGMGSVQKAVPAKNEFAEHLVSKPIQSTVSVEKKEAKSDWGGAQSETKNEVPGLFETNGMSITIEGGSTMNLGNYESARIGVSITIPCHPNTLNDAYTWGLAWVGERIEAETKAAKG